jgi:hypothetical protein
MKLGSAVRQATTEGNEATRAKLIAILARTRREIYGLLAEDEG